MEITLNWYTEGDHYYRKTFAEERTQHCLRHFQPSYRGCLVWLEYFRMNPGLNLPEASIGLHHISKNVEREECNNKMMLDTYRVR